MKSKLISALLLGLGFFLLGSSAAAQTPALPDAPISHVTLSATFTGLNSGGQMHSGTIDTFGVQLTKYVTVSYEHVQVPDLNSRYELGVVTYSNTFPKIKALLFDSSNFVYSVGAGAGKYLSPAGNHWAETVTAGITYPIAGHMGWQLISYQYIHAPVSGLVNKSYQTASSGPLFFF